MTAEEFNKAMSALADSNDEEVSHREADKLMCRLLTELGYGDGVKHFEEMRKWYA